MVDSRVVSRRILVCALVALAGLQGCGLEHPKTHPVSGNGDAESTA